MGSLAFRNLKMECYSIWKYCTWSEVLSSPTRWWLKEDWLEDFKPRVARPYVRILR